jgi:hypothetical protein
MAFATYLVINEEVLPLPVSYDFSLSDIEADSSGETEAGTTQRDIIRSGVAEIDVEFQVSPSWLKKLSSYRSIPELSVQCLNTVTMELETRSMYMDGFKTSLVQDTSKKGLWKVSLTLKEY